MAQKELALYVAEQLAPLGEIRFIPMMGGCIVAQLSRQKSKIFIMN
ncbi:MAG: hypothetical protein ACLU6W_14740 [Lachnospiraceae bacterium]